MIPYRVRPNARGAASVGNQAVSVSACGCGRCMRFKPDGFPSGDGPQNCAMHRFGPALRVLAQKLRPYGAAPSNTGKTHQHRAFS